MVQFTYEGRDLEAMAFARSYHTWILEFFRPFLRKRVVEVGAGSGGFSELLLHEPIDTLVAVEPSENMYRALLSRIGSDARVICVNDIFSHVCVGQNNVYDTIIYVNVLEHIERDSDELATAYESLRPGGHICIFVPALRFLYSAHDASIGHVRRYHKRELIALVQRTGFSVVRARYFDIFGVLPWLIVMKYLRGEPDARKVKLYDQFVVPLARLFERMFQPPFGKNLILVARKPD